MSLLRRLIWYKSKGFFPWEISVIKMLLPMEDERGERLFRQASDAPCVRRKRISGGGYRASIPFVRNSSLLIELHEGLRSPLLDLRDSCSGRLLQFHLELLKGGFLGALVCDAVDNMPLPPSWDLTGNNTTKAQPNWLPQEVGLQETAAILSSLYDWVDISPPSGVSDFLSVRRGARPDEIAELEEETSGVLPREYCDFLVISNGLKVGSFTVGGTHELELIEPFVPGVFFWLVEHLNDGGVVMMRANELAQEIIIADEQSREPRIFSSNLQAFLSNLMKEASQKQ